MFGSVVGILHFTSFFKNSWNGDLLVLHCQLMPFRIFFYIKINWIVKGCMPKRFLYPVGNHNVFSVFIENNVKFPISLLDLPKIFLAWLSLGWIFPSDVLTTSAYYLWDRNLASNKGVDRSLYNISIYI